MLLVFAIDCQDQGYEELCETALLERSFGAGVGVIIC